MTLFFLVFLISGLGNNRRQLASPYGKQDSSLARSNREKQVPLQMDSIFPRMVSSYIHQLVCIWTPIPVRKPGSNIEKLKKLVSMIYQDLPLGFRKSSFLIMSLVTCCSSSWFQFQRSTGSRKKPHQFENTAWRTNEVWGRHSNYVPSIPQPAIIIYYIIY